MNTNDRSFLEAVLLGYESQLATINNSIADLQRRLGQRSAPAVTRRKPKKHKISAEGRARISAAQRKRWAAKKKGE